MKSERREKYELNKSKEAIAYALIITIIGTLAVRGAFALINNDLPQIKDNFTESQTEIAIKNNLTSADLPHSEINLKSGTVIPDFNSKK